MRVGYPCINRSIGCTASSTFRLASYSEERMKATVANNLACLRRILHYNIQNGILFFRISSDMIPFASHPVCKFDWAGHFKTEFKELGGIIRENNMRISMHPDQFTLLNSSSDEITGRSMAELKYHCEVLDTMGLDPTAKVQIHVGGVYGDKPAAVARFAERFKKLDHAIRRRLAIENDHRLFSLKDCMAVHNITGAPVIFDSFHHECLNNGEAMREAVKTAQSTWEKQDGILMCDYSGQKAGAPKGAHTEHIDLAHFRGFLKQTKGIDFDVMLEIKDKERSALEALETVRRLNR